MQLDKESTLIVVDQVDAMTLWGALERNKKKPVESFNVLLSGIELYEADPLLQSRYGSANCPSTLFNIHHFQFLIKRQVLRFTIISVPKVMSLTTFDGFAQGLVIIVNTNESDWETQLSTAWSQAKQLEGIKAMVAYSDPRVESCKLWTEIQAKAEVIRMGLLTQERLQAFYGMLGQICAENRGRLSTITVARRAEAEVKRIVASPAAASEDKKRRCELM